MLVQFSIKNFKTFKDKVTLSMVASNYDKSDLEGSNVFDIENYSHRLLKSAVVYGANASGKTKFIDALAFMRWFVINSSTKTQEGDEISVDSFKLSTQTENAPSEFEVIFLINECQYRYGFEADKNSIKSEWLFQKKLTLKPKEVELFYREGLEIDFHKSFQKMKRVTKDGDDILRDNALILSLSNQFKVKEAKEISNYFRRIGFLLGNEPDHYESFSLNEIFESTEIGLKIIETIKRFDIGISNINVREVKSSDGIKSPKELLDKIDEIIKKNKDTIIIETESVHRKYDNDYNYVDNEVFNFSNMESAGTQKLLAVLGPIYDSLVNGNIVFIDELDSRLHPNIVSHLIKLFNSSETNPKNAQLIFNTHNTNLLNENLFRRDQVWFTQKNRYGEGKLFSLAEFKVRKGENFEERYLDGRYGGIPFLENISNLFNS
ncbi:AAA family ATPase [Flavobacterium daejeonense]|uniref:AAA family ATPase n=1 Tax=Flavobacterium daejeonense TaxID=350893 RepID=UPI00047CD90E|nr:ATP-binding protein [Flavobacterium daejeonense]